MHSTAIGRAGAAAVVLLAMAGCHDDGFGTHGCPLNYGDGWRNYGLALEHVEPSGCPVFISQPGTRLTTVE